MSKLKNLRFIRNSPKWTAYHTHTTGNTFFVVNRCPSHFITFNSIDTTSSGTRTFFFCNGVVRTNTFTLSALDTFFLINHRFSFYYRNCSFGANFLTGMSYTSSAHIGNFIHFCFTGITGRRNYLHQRRLIIFFINITSL